MKIKPVQIIILCLTIATLTASACGKAEDKKEPEKGRVIITKKEEPAPPIPSEPQTTPIQPAQKTETDKNKIEEPKKENNLTQNINKNINQTTKLTDDELFALATERLSNYYNEEITFERYDKAPQQEIQPETHNKLTKLITFYANSNTVGEFKVVVYRIEEIDKNISEDEYTKASLEYNMWLDNINNKVYMIWDEYMFNQYKQQYEEYIRQFIEVTGLEVKNIETYLNEAEPMISKNTSFESFIDKHRIEATIQIINENLTIEEMEMLLYNIGEALRINNHTFNILIEDNNTRYSLTLDTEETTTQIISTSIAE